MDSEKYCPTCGRPLGNKREGPGDTVRRCPKCQHSVNRYDNFCRYCGQTLREECKHEEAMVEISTTCVCCRAEKSYTLPASRVRAWRNGTLIQEAFPEMTVEDREFLISGICPECWNKLF